MLPLRDIEGFPKIFQPIWFSRVASLSSHIHINIYNERIDATQTSKEQ